MDFIGERRRIFMESIRKRFDAVLKAKVAVEAVKGSETVAEIAGDLLFIPIRSASGKSRRWKVCRWSSRTSDKDKSAMPRKRRPSFTSRLDN